MAAVTRSIGVAVLQVVLPDQLAVEVHAVRIVDRRSLEEVEPAHLRRRDDVAQLAVGEGVIADEVDAFDFRRGAFGDFEHEVDAILLELDDLRLDAGGKEALPAIDVENALHVGLGLGAREHRSRLELDLAGQRRRIDLAVAFEGDLVDDRVFLDRHDDGRTLVVDRNVGEEAGRKQRLDRGVDFGGTVGDRPLRIAGRSVRSPARRDGCRRPRCVLITP